MSDLGVQLGTTLTGRNKHFVPRWKTGRGSKRGKLHGHSADLAAACCEILCTKNGILSRNYEPNLYGRKTCRMRWGPGLL